jgi:hypothetical protein
MTTKEYCLSSPTIAYSPILGGIEIKGIEYGIDDFIYATTKTNSTTTFHKLKVYYTDKYTYIRLNGYRCSLLNFIKLK